jgi:short-subunit dehydrogenase
LVARNEQRLNAVADRLSRETGRRITVLPADLNDKAALAKVEAILREDPSLTMLVNNAGVGSVASILQANVDKMEEMIDLNITALTRLSYAAAPAFVARGAGTIINIASVVGIAVEALNGVYSASKSYVISFGHSLVKDLADKGVRVQTVLPGATATESWDIAGTRRRRRRTPPCRPKTASTRRCPASTRVRKSPSPASMKANSGPAGRQTAGKFPRNSTMRSRRPVTASPRTPATCADCIGAYGPRPRLKGV